MRLLETNTGRFHYFNSSRDASYAILSHVWQKNKDSSLDAEQTFYEVRQAQEATARHESVLPRLNYKIRRFCAVARDAGFKFGWVDTCCIDKLNSSEVSEAVNSMFSWYRDAGACYVALPDVDEGPESTRDQQFRNSVWFTRSWTLQELLAPTVVIFLTTRWSIIGSKHTLSPLIEDVTDIDRDILMLDRSLFDAPVACRLSWASKRTATVEEDIVYSLMGILGINIPTIYGEGSSAAFSRLQEEILRRIPDQSILAWGSLIDIPDHPLVLDAASSNHNFVSRLGSIVRRLSRSLSQLVYLLPSGGGRASQARGNPRASNTGQRLATSPSDFAAWSCLGISERQAGDRRDPSHKLYPAQYARPFRRVLTRHLRRPPLSIITSQTPTEGDEGSVRRSERSRHDHATRSKQPSELSSPGLTRGTSIPGHGSFRAKVCFTRHFM